MYRSTHSAIFPVRSAPWRSDARHLSDRLGPGSLTVYTSRLDTHPPVAVRGLARSAPGLWPRSPDLAAQPRAGPLLLSGVPGETQLGSTVATMFDTNAARASTEYRVEAVDQEGNAGP